MNRNSDFIQTRGDSSSSEEDGRQGAFADDDSVVSSNVTNDEAQTLTRGGLDMVESGSNENKKAGIMPRNGKEWCIVIVALMFIVIAAAGTGIGLGFYFMNKGSNNNNSSAGGSSPTTKDFNDNDDLNSDGFEQETYNGTDDNMNSTTSLPTDFAGSVVYHMVAQDISELASFEGIADNGSSSSPSPQQRARDWLVFSDMLPVNLADEQDEQMQSINGTNGTDPTDDLVNYSNNLSSIYLDVNTPAYRVAQRFAVAVFYFATKGDEWDAGMQWLQPGLNECDYPGIRCEEVTIPSISLADALKNPDYLPRHSDGTVDTTTERMIVEINLPESNLSGKLPSELMTFPFLKRLGLWSNQIEGQIPGNIGRLQNLESLLLDDNNFTGDIAAGIGSLGKLKMLSLGFNPNMGGQIPFGIGNLYDLEALLLPNMSLRGNLPSSMQNLEKLKNLELQSNDLRGGLPEWLGFLTNLEKLNLSGNGFNGEIPEGLSKLINLRELELQDNDLGTIPCSALEKVAILSANCQSIDGTSCDCCTLCV
eukprot:CAMPEP_0201685450 /NCGR_PEP_ID=MMETSP0578-20130828/193_1 /ASSEMBLY_ACC=CAM_ASM_000663 /TAXON_ID=267565 /ORGANISM="Skeletonema grethea, Strain CCMP 1804" /LENGTH=535 /DNA_ID=CAMNT_0048169335 /DNA_START=104 /DNA_END=1711 /DNA_ORIENTATION=-